MYERRGFLHRDRSQMKWRMWKNSQLAFGHGYDLASQISDSRNERETLINMQPHIAYHKNVRLCLLIFDKTLVETDQSAKRPTKRHEFKSDALYIKFKTHVNCSFFLLNKKEYVEASKIFLSWSRVKSMTYFRVNKCMSSGVPKKKNDKHPPMADCVEYNEDG